MAGRWTGGKVVGEYLLGRRIGSGSFSVVWYAQHRLQGTEVAIKEIAMDRLSRKLQDNLLQEIVVLKKINHPNIISLHDIIETPGKIFLVLELCKGGDLSVLIQRHGRISETKAKNFMQQLASGLQVLRDTNLIHRDLKPQNLLLSRNDDDAVLKIADFGFARSLQPRGLADTLCGSPLYMAPEIMQLLKYDAKADLWSVGVILFQLVTGRTPFTGSNQIQLLQNILRSTELQFPVHVNQLSGDCIDLCQKLLRRNPVERLTFEEFFSHPFLSQSLWKESTSPAPPKGMVDALFDVHSPASPPSTNIQDDGLPFILDNLHEKPIIQADETMVKPTIGFSVGAKVGSAQAISQLLRTDSPPENKPKQTLEMTSSRVDHCKSSLGNINEFKALVDMEGSNIPEDRNVVDSLEFIDREYVLVSAFGPLEASSSSIAPSRPCNSPPEPENLPASCPKPCAISSPMSIWSITGKPHAMESLESHSSHPSVTSQGSMDMGEVIEQPSSHCMTRIKSLQLCAYAITALVNERVVNRPLEAFSIQLVILAIWKQALHICHAQAASATEGSPSQDARLRGNTRRNHVQDSRESNVSTDSIDPDIQSDIEKAFLSEVETAEDLAKNLESDDTTVMPDAMEVIFHSALTLGRNGAVEELMDNMESATALYSKAVQLLHFLLVEAPSLFLNPPFSLTATDRYRLRSYIEILNNRHNRYRSQRMDLLKSEAHQQSL